MFLVYQWADRSGYFWLRSERAAAGAEATGTGSLIFFLENIYAFKKQSAAPDPVKDLLITGTVHTGPEKYWIRLFLEWDRISGRILFRLQDFFSSRAYDIYGVVKSVFSELRRTIRFVWYPTSL